MNAEDVYDAHDGLGLAELVRRGEIAPRELLEVARRRTEARNPRLGAVVTACFDRAEREIERGLPGGPFRGVPFLVKDLRTHVAGVPTSEGSRFFAGEVPERDVEMVRRYRAAGLVIFGKTNTPELGLSCSTEPLLHGPTRNPWDPRRTAGGSSGGAAAATAAGLVPFAHGTDGGGSIRIPASCCGLFGLKPTRARTPIGPLYGEGWSGMSCGHALTRSVRDSAALLDAVSGPAPGDPYVAPAPARRFLEEVGADPGHLRIAFSTARSDGGRVDAECRRAVEAAAALCAELGHEVREDAPRYDAGALTRATTVIIAANVACAVDARAEALGRKPADDELEAVTRAMVELGRAGTPADYAGALVAMHRVGREIAAFFEDTDAFLTPTLGRVPVPLGTIDQNGDFARYGLAAVDFVPFTGVWNATGQPAMSVPLHWTEEGLPVGVQFAARFGDEATLLRLAGQLEGARPWFARRPPALAPDGRTP